MARRITEILDNQEIARVARFFNGCQLEVDALGNFGTEFGVAFFGAFKSKVAQESVFSALAAVQGILGIDKLSGNVKSRQQDLSGQTVMFAFGDDFAHIGNGLG